jgi:hypothetical protein
MDLFTVCWIIAIGYPALQAWALWQCRGVWRSAALAVLATAGVAYLWCAWVLFISPRGQAETNLSGLYETMALAFGGPAVMLVLAGISVGDWIRGRTRSSPSAGRIRQP